MTDQRDGRWMVPLALLCLALSIVLARALVGVAVAFDLIVLPRIIASRRCRSGAFMMSFERGPFPGQPPRDLDTWLGFHRNKKACTVGMWLTAVASVILAQSVGTLLWLALTYLTVPYCVRNELRSGGAGG